MDKTKLLMRKLHSKKERTYREAREIAICYLDRALESEDFQSTIYDLDDVDTGNTNVNRLMSDPKMQAAFRKYCRGIVGSFQYMEKTVKVTIDRGKI